MARDELFAKLFAESIRKGPANAAASDRFHGFRLAMLKEIFALRAWDFSEWREALEDQSDAVFEVLRADTCPPQFAAGGIRLAVQARAFEEKDPFTQHAIAVLDFTNDDERARLVRQLLKAHPLQSFDTLDALTLISDAIPTGVLVEVADWCVHYVRELSGPMAKVRGSKAAPLAFWSEILPIVDDPLQLCNRLFPGFVVEAEKLGNWLEEGSEAIRVFLRFAIPEHATEIIERMIAIKNVAHQPLHMGRWAMIFDTLVSRPELRAPGLIAALRDLLAAPQIAGLPIFRHYLHRLETGDTADRPISDPEFAAWLRERINRLVGTREDQAFSTQWFGLVEWTEHDAEMVTRLIEAIDQTNRSCSSITTFLRDLSNIVKSKNEVLNRQIAGALSRWLAAPPIGENRNQISPFSIFRVTAPDQRHVLGALASLSAELLRLSMLEEQLPVLHSWLRAIAVDPPAPAAPTLAYTAFRCGLTANIPVAWDLMSAGREITLRALSRADDHPEWRNALRRTLWRCCTLIDETLADATSISGALQKPTADGMLQLLQAVVPRLALSRDADIRAVAAKVARKLSQVMPVGQEISAALEQLAGDARARVRRYARNES